MEPRAPSMLLALVAAVLAHFLLALAIFWQTPDSGAIGAGIGGLEVSMGAAGGIAGSAEAVPADEVTETKPETAAEMAPPDTMTEATPTEDVAETQPDTAPPVEAAETSETQPDSAAETAPAPVAEMSPDTVTETTTEAPVETMQPEPMEQALPPAPADAVPIETQAPTVAAVVPVVPVAPETPVVPDAVAAQPMTPDVVEAVEAEPLAFAPAPQRKPTPPKEMVERVRRPQPQRQPEPEPQPQQPRRAPEPQPQAQPETQPEATPSAQPESEGETETASRTPAGDAANQGNRGSGTREASGGNPGAKRDYMAEIAALINRHRRYPRRAQSRRQEGTGHLFVSIASDGRIVSSRLNRSTGHRLLDDEIRSILERVGRMPPIPEELGSNLQIVVPITFDLR